MPALYPLFEMLEVAEETKKLQKTAQEALLNRPIDLTKAQDSTMHSRSADPKLTLTEVPGYSKWLHLPALGSMQRNLLEQRFTGWGFAGLFLIIKNKSIFSLLAPLRVAQRSSAYGA